ncbi:methyltransferase [Halovenus marina]|uniref:methyltransferase n=1 Tax=Halovenus marina TaxID=3396621 RepID=UPI003F568B3D
MVEERPKPDHLMKIGFGFQASKTLLTAVRLGVFDALSDNPRTKEQLENDLGLHPRSSADFFDALVALDVLDREGGVYQNTPEAEAFLVSGKPSYIGGIFEMANDRLYPFWGDLEEGLRTGKPTNELEGTETHPFEAIYEDDERLEQFVGAMTGMSMGVANALAHEFPWQEYDTVLDLGTSEGIVPKRIAEENDHIRATGVDLPRVEPYFQGIAGESPVADRIEFQTGDFFGDEPLPKADVYILGHILHDWDLDERQQILDKVAEAVTDDGAVIIYGTMIDEERRENEMGLLMSLNMLVETPNGFDYTHSECIEWLRGVGFTDPRIEQLPGPESMVVAQR